MRIKITFTQAFLVISLFFSLTGCGSGPRAEDAAPMQEQVPTQPVAPTATADLSDQGATQAQPTEPAAVETGPL